ncbi:hypothetical protein [Ottowia sp. VDI28]|uniref:hypothetical protein n=1 Tax=Ottowia sp. VDI28 TaxID=3133968 RepID=UPI003C2DE3BA
MRATVIAAAIWHAIRSGAFALPSLPEGVTEGPDGTYEAKCRACGERYEILCDLADFDPDYSYCGGSPRCLP